jgi:hypothetical protein
MKNLLKENWGAIVCKFISNDNLFLKKVYISLFVKDLLNIEKATKIIETINHNHAEYIENGYLNDLNFEDGVYTFDRNFDKIILLVFEGGSGGHFLSNCLSLSDEILSSHGKKEDKVAHIEKCFSLQNTSNSLVWNNILVNDIKKTDSQSYFFILAHPIYYTTDTKMNKIKHCVDRHLDFWKGCKKIIILKNSNLFTSLRKCVWKQEELDNNIERFDNSFKNISLMDYFNLTENQQIRLKKVYEDDFQLYSSCDLNTRKETYIWDTNWFLSKVDTLDNVKYFYDYFNLSGFDVNVIGWYYDLWINELQNMSKMITLNYQ